MNTDPNAPRDTWARYQHEAFTVVGAIWLDDGTLAGWQLSIDTEPGFRYAPRYEDDEQSWHEADPEYMATQTGRYLSDEDEIIDHD